MLTVTFQASVYMMLKKNRDSLEEEWAKVLVEVKGDKGRQTVEEKMKARREQEQRQAQADKEKLADPSKITAEDLRGVL